MNNLLTKSLPVLLVAVTLLGVAMPVAAHADDRGYDRGHDRDWGHREYEWNSHERWAHDWHRRHVVFQPGVVYAPPPVYYTPPPQPAGINLIIPFDLR